MTNFHNDDVLSVEQEEALNSLQYKLQDLDHPDCLSRPSLIRWLRSRSWNEQEAEKMLRKHINWRIEHNVDTILSWYKMPEVVDKYFPGGICGSDKQGRPLFIAPVGCLDPKTFMRAVSRADFIQSRIYQMEYILRVVLPEASENTNQEISQLSVITDMQGLGFKHMSPSWLSILSESVATMESNYPEILGICFVVNAPPLFSKLYGFLRPMLSKATQEKIHVLDSNYQETLLRHFNADSLPAFYGGTLVDPDGDPRCPSRICWAGPVPECYFTHPRSSNESTISRHSVSRSSSAQSLSCKEQLTAVEIDRGAQRDIPVGFLPAGAELHWYVLCESHDIGIGWFVKPTDGVDFKPTRTRPGVSAELPSYLLDSTQGHPGRQSTSIISDKSRETGGSRDKSLTEVVPVRRITGSMSPSRGKCKIRIPGSYYMRLDNSYSWMRVKRVRYAFKVVAPKCPTEQPSIPNFYPPFSTNLVRHSVVDSDHDELFGACSSDDISVLPIPPENRSRSLLVTGGSMDVDISLLFRLLAQLLLVSKMEQTKPPSE
ncbi:unnamed protein product [Dicrocoelium dendriticum]|nr:unnamed protein product [Dicrocoelium dendriticum]